MWSIGCVYVAKSLDFMSLWWNRLHYTRIFRVWFYSFQSVFILTYVAVSRDTLLSRCTLLSTLRCDGLAWHGEEAKSFMPERKQNCSQMLCSISTQSNRSLWALGHPHMYCWHLQPGVQQLGTKLPHKTTHQQLKPQLQIQEVATNSSWKTTYISSQNFKMATCLLVLSHVDVLIYDRVLSSKATLFV